MHYDRDYRGLTQSYGVDKLNLYGHGFSSHNLQFKFLKNFFKGGPRPHVFISMGGPRPHVFSGPATICRIDLFEILDLESWPMNKFICCILGLDRI